MKVRERTTIVSQECLCDGIYSMWIATTAAEYAAAGQFLMVYPNSDARLLARPISICEIDNTQDKGKLRIVYRVVGEGTEEFSRLGAGDTLELLGPLGNGFFNADIKEIKADTKALLIGGGIGIPPMLELAKELSCNVTIVAGYRSSDELFLTRELESNGDLYISTDDGSIGTAGTVIDAITEHGISADMIFACGPRPMLKGVKRLSEEWDIPAYISMEERMACGIGVCLGCVCQSTDTDQHSKVRNKRVCAEGPVFDAAEVVL